MAFNFTGNDTNGIVVTVSGDTWANLAGTVVTIAGFDDAFDFAAFDNTRLYVAGLIASEDGDAIASASGADGNVIHVLPGGSVLSGSDGIELEGNNHRVINDGTIEGTTDAAVQFLGTGNFLTNNGTMSGSRTVLMEGASNTLVNNGTITSTSNNATVSGFDGSTSVINNGTIVGSTVAVSYFTSGAQLGGELINNGTITVGAANGIAVNGSANGDGVRNGGTIDGRVSLNDGNDVFRNAHDGIVDGAIDGGAGNDRLVGGNATDHFIGGAGLDALFGGAADDTLDGGADNDVLRGQGDDDLLTGGTGLDNLAGGRGNDTLNGGPQQDILNGGAGEDVFVYTANGWADRVTDFRNDVDALDLSSFNFATRAAALLKFVDVGGNVEFRSAPGAFVVIEDLTKALIANDLIL